jgi:ABC-type transport system involved in multi-copper enzyme maturation permease subunit
MTAYLSFEWLKLSKRWMPRIILVMMAGLTLVAFWAQASRVEGYGNLVLPRGWLAALTYASFFAPFFWPVLGGSWSGNEYGWGTIRTILTRRPNRITHVLAALAVLLAGVALAIAVLLIAGTAAGLLVAAFNHDAAFTASLWNGTFLVLLLKGAATAWYISAFYLILAYSAAVIFRSAAVGIGIGIGATLAQVVLTRIFFALGGTWQTIAQHFPFLYTDSMITRVVGSGLIPGTSLATSSPTDPSAGGSLLALAIYLAVFLALCLAAVRLRDVTA